MEEQFWPEDIGEIPSEDEAQERRHLLYLRIIAVAMILLMIVGYVLL